MKYLLTILMMPLLLSWSGGTETHIDKELRITSPILGSKVNAKVVIKGRAIPGSWVQVTVSSTYYELGKDMQKERVYKGSGPLNGPARTVKVKTSPQGIWTVSNISFRNNGWSTNFKIVARSVEGKNATYVTVVNEVRPVVNFE